MTWLRSNGFYYRSERDWDTVRSIYVGTGFVAEARLEYDAQRQAAAAEEAAAWRQERAEIDAEDAEMTTLAAHITILTRATLYTAGYYRHRQGAWRKRRDT